eukprot:CAMPEP_0113535042 /NCGR_PEP_ID=MMETSP0015_2-20120614/5482_1 /TAXON_ID=2838 /ORGANISM="Odontella" /LENGTH=332 /DNA_ID=CAMNT_0000434245 /DNA_START=70 /DNA_END=1068 /DNA_ORIENTATION=+ /assembly_acc=CAM_ASM_000160
MTARSCDALLAPAVMILALASLADAFVPERRRASSVDLPGRKGVAFVGSDRRHPSSRLMSSGGKIPEDDDEGQSLASDFFKALQDRNIQLEGDDFLDDDDDEDDDEEEDEDEEDEEEINFPQGAINAMTGFDAGGVGDLAGNVTLTNKQVYDELKERVLESAGGFVELVGGANDDDEDGEDAPKEYKSPVKVPDPELTAGEVVTTVLDALLHNSNPSPNRGVEVLFGYSSPGSAVMTAVRDEGMTAEEYADFLEDSEYKVLFEHEDVMIDKGDYSFDRKKAFYNARIRVGEGALDFVSVNFILSTQGNEEDDCWLIDSMLIRPEKMRRRRRR